MPAFLIRQVDGKRSEDVLVSDPELGLTFDAGWAIFTDAHGVCLAIPAGQGASIQRVDDQEPAPHKE